MFKVLSVNADNKTKKGYETVLTGILYLAPSDVSGYDVCPNATPGCKEACLFTAGRGVYKRTQESRIKKTRWLMEDRESFMAALVKDIKALIRKAKRENKPVAIRLNGTSDIAWEKYPVTVDGVKYRNLMVAFPNEQFYDYTKILGRKSALRLSNYHLTFSLSENNDAEAVKALRQGYNVAVVLNVRRKETKPDVWSGVKVVDGDVNDIRFNDPKGGVIIALTAKGKARYDTTGFVRNVNDNLIAKG